VKVKTGIYQGIYLGVLTFFLLTSDRAADSIRSVNGRHVNVQGGPAKVRPTYIFDGNI